MRQRPGAAAARRVKPDTVVPLEADETIAPRQHGQPLRIGVRLVHERIAFFIGERRDARVREPDEPFGRIEHEPGLEEGAQVAHGREPVRALHLDVGQPMQLVGLTRRQHHTTGVHEVTDRELGRALRVERDRGRVDQERTCRDRDVRRL